MAKGVFGLEGIGPKKEQTLINNGYTCIEDLKKAEFYEILELPGFGMHTTYRIWESLGREVPCIDMQEVTESLSQKWNIENKTIKPWRIAKKKGMTSLQPENFKIETTTVWSYPKRGDWATHNPQYRGNWPPQVARNIIELYSKPGDVVLDPMVGGGTTPVECRLTGRNSISVDVNRDAVEIARDRLDFQMEGDETVHRTFMGDVRNLDLIEDESIDLIATHPPYANIIHYAPLVKGDLSEFNHYDVFFKEFRRAIKEFMRVLKPGCYCAVMIGDTHNKSYYVPISTRMMLEFLKEGFVLKEDIIKKEWNCESDRYLKKYASSEFLFTMQEHILIFRKQDDRIPNSSIDFFKGCIHE